MSGSPATERASCCARNQSTIVLSLWQRGRGSRRGASPGANFCGAPSDRQGMNDDLTDAEVLRQSLREPARFALLYERHAAAVHRYLRRRLGDDVAEDLAAETFVRAFRGRARYGVQHDTALPW